MKSYDRPFLCKLEILISCDQFIRVFFCLSHPETLTGLTDLFQAEIIQLYCNHIFLRPLHLMPNYSVFISIAIIRAFFIFCADKTVILVLVQIYIAVITFTFFVIYIIRAVIAACCFHLLFPLFYSQIFHGAFPLCQRLSRRFFSRRVSMHCQKPLWR